MSVVQQHAHAEPLKRASLRSQRRAWTQAITAAVIASCQDMGWDATAIGHKSDLLPVLRSEYLALDVMAFAPNPNRWKYPVAVFELEDKGDEDYIAYTLWKLLCVRVELRVLLCYRGRSDDGLSLIHFLNEQVIAALTFPQRQALGDDTLIGIGSRADAALIATSYQTALRRSELAALTLADIAAEDEGYTLTIQHGKGGKRRQAYVYNDSARILAAWLAERGSEPGPVFCRIRKGGHLVIDKPLSGQGLQDTSSASAPNKRTSSP